MWLLLCLAVGGEAPCLIFIHSHSSPLAWINISFSLLLCLMMMSTPGSPHIVDGSRLSDVQHPRPAAATPITPAHKSAPRHGSLHTSQHYIADDTSIIIKETVCSSICTDHSTLPSTTADYASIILKATLHPLFYYSFDQIFLSEIMNKKSIVKNIYSQTKCIF